MLDVLRYKKNANQSHNEIPLHTYQDGYNNFFFFFFLKQSKCWSSHCGTVEPNLTGNHEVAGSIPGLTQWIKDLALP